MTHEPPNNPPTTPADADKSGGKCDESTLEVRAVDSSNPEDSNSRDGHLALVAIAPDSDTKAQIDIPRKDWLSVARIAAASDRLDAREVARMMDL